MTVTARRAGTVYSIEINRIHPDPGNPRGALDDLEDLAASITRQGIIAPLVVMAHPVKPGRFQVLVGHRRLAAAGLAGLSDVPCVISRGKTPAESIELALVENGQRRDLDPLEEARALARLIDLTGITRQEAGRRIGRSGAHVTQRLQLLELSPAVQAELKAGRIPLSAAVDFARRRNGTAGSRPNLFWFGAAHPLAAEARGRCRQEHRLKGVRLVGGQACGACWEHAIRADARALLGAAS